MRRSWQEQTQAETRQKAMEDLQDYTHNLEAMYSGLRSFKHDYVNILLSMSGYIEHGDMDELKDYFENKGNRLQKQDHLFYQWGELPDVHTYDERGVKAEPLNAESYVFLCFSILHVCFFVSAS